jgi:hypothetical protein
MLIRGSLTAAEPREIYLPPDRPDWYWSPKRGCAPINGKVNTLFTSEEQADQDKAVTICRARCPFVKECDRWATEHGEKRGVWGGRRREGARPRPSAALPPAPADTPDQELIAGALPGNGPFFRKLSDKQKQVVIAAALERGYTWSLMAQRLKTPLITLRALHDGAEIPDLDGQVQKLYDANRNDHEIAAALGVPKQVVARIRKRLDLPAKWCGQGRMRKAPGTPVTSKAEMAKLRARVRELHRKGLSDTAIAAQLDQTKRRVHHVRTALGLPPHFKQGRPRRTGAAA